LNREIYLNAGVYRDAEPLPQALKAFDYAQKKSAQDLAEACRQLG